MQGVVLLVANVAVVRMAKTNSHSSSQLIGNNQVEMIAFLSVSSAEEHGIQLMVN